MSARGTGPSKQGSAHGTGTLEDVLGRPKALQKHRRLERPGQGWQKAMSLELANSWDEAYTPHGINKKVPN